MDPSDCDNIAERMYNVIKQDDAVQTFSPMARLMSSDMTPAEKMFALLGAGVITMNQSVQVASQAILSLVDECDSMIAASIAMSKMNDDLKPQEKRCQQTKNQMAVRIVTQSRMVVRVDITQSRLAQMQSMR